MRILFVDQTSKLGGAELSLLDIAKAHAQDCLVCLFEDGDFRIRLEQQNTPVKVISESTVHVKKSAGFFEGVWGLLRFLPLVYRVWMLSLDYDVIYCNTQKAMVVGSLASFFSRRPLVFHLRDIISPDHFSQINRKLITFLSNRFSSLVIANSEATRDAFIAEGGDLDRVQVIHNGFEADRYEVPDEVRTQLRQKLDLDYEFVVGHFSRLSPWKGQHVLIDALLECPDDVVAILVGDTLFGETEYAKQLEIQVAKAGLEDRVRFLGFRSDVPELLAACDLVVHSSTAPEPFGRVIVEAMLAKRPIIASQAGGALELIEHGETGWLCHPGDAQQLAQMIAYCHSHRDQMRRTIENASKVANEKFNIRNVNKKIAHLVRAVVQQGA